MRTDATRRGRLSREEFLAGARKVTRRRHGRRARGAEGRAHLLATTAQLVVAAVEQANRLQAYTCPPREFLAKVAANLVIRGVYDDLGERAILLAVAGCDSDPELLERYTAEEERHAVEIPLIHHAITNAVLERSTRKSGESTKVLFERLLQTRG